MRPKEQDAAPAHSDRDNAIITHSHKGSQGEPEKLDALGRLTSGIAHDFNNVLAGIIGFAELAIREIQPEGDGAEYLQMIIQKADDASGYVRQLLQFGTDEAEEVAPVSLNDVVDKSIKFLSRYLEQNIEVETELEKSLAMISASRVDVERILTNLCINARDAMPEGGRLSIHTENLGRPFSGNSLRLSQAVDYVKLTVSDNGIGMDDSTRRRIFTPYFTTKTPDRSTGLGLFVVQSLVERLGGAIQCQSSLGMGTRFEIFLPVTQPPETHDHPAYTPSPGRGTFGTLLLVEDEPHLLKSYQSVLQQAGYQVLTAQNGRQALEVVSSREAEIDLIVCDLIMPQMGGIELFQRLSEEAEEIPFLFISGHPEAIHACTGCLQKPFRSEELIANIQQILDAAVGQRLQPLPFR